jgi:hypothetical protein
MPTAVALAVVTALGETSAAYLIGAIVYWAAVAVVNLTISYALNKFESALTGSKSQNQQPVPQGFTARGSVYPGSIIYGQTRSSGVAVYEYSRP